MKFSRSSNFELMRIVCMLLIILSHYACHGVMDVNSNYLASNVPILNRLLCVNLAQWGGAAVGCFFMLSGYFLIEKERGKIIKIIVQAISYALLTTLVYLILYCFCDIQVFPKKDFLFWLYTIVLLPVSGSGWWFITAYILMILITPYVNPFLQRLSKKRYIVLLILFWLLWGVLGLIASKFGKCNVNNIHKALLFYATGAYIKRFHSESQSKNCLKIIFALIISGIIYTVIRFFADSFDTNTLYKVIFVGFGKIFTTTVIVPVNAILIFIFFKNLRLPESKKINMIASSTFGIYLFHDSQFIRPVLWNQIIDVNSNLYPTAYFIILCIPIAICVFCLCFGIDSIMRKFAFPYFENILNSLFSLNTSKGEK